MFVEVLVFVGLLALGCAPLFWRPPGGAWRRSSQLGAVTLVALAALAAWWTSDSRAPVALSVERPNEVVVDDYVSSRKCRACHPSQYSTWHQSYHRTMTQVAAPGAVLGDFDDVTLSLRGVEYKLSRRGDEYFIASRDSQEKVTEARQWKEKRVQMLTGSHHYQVYWVSDGWQGEVHTFPFVYLIEDQRWAPRESVFLRPPGPQHDAPWNDVCIQCHATHGRPRPDLENERVETRVVEFGIACEACHGPARKHVELNSAPQRRYGLHLDDERKGDRSIVQPRSLTTQRASQVCGNCHSSNVFRDKPQYYQSGSPFKPGEDLDAVKMIAWPRSGMTFHDSDKAFIDEAFWSDGIIRIAGREYNGMLDSGCHQRGEMGCHSCHQIHGEDPDDQLADGMRGDKACVQCHTEETYASAAHTHHPAESSGARCQNCHMPYTVFGLLKSIRSHTIDTPSVKVTKEVGRPNGCNGCHVDKTLAWTQGHMSTWYGAEPVTLSQDEREVSVTVLNALRGDAADRALAVWALGWPQARAVSGDLWQIPILIQLLDDPYDTVRYVAGKRLQAQPGFEDFEYDFVAPPAQRAEAVERARARWRGAPGASGAVLIDDQGQLRRARFEALLKQRDDSPVSLPE